MPKPGSKLALVVLLEGLVEARVRLVPGLAGAAVQGRVRVVDAEPSRGSRSCRSS